VDRQAATRGESGVGDPIVARVGIISDTHGFLHDSIHSVFAGVDRIVHAGDIGGEIVLLEIETIAPVTAVLGNTDRSLPGRDLRARATIRVADVDILVVHDPQALSPIAMQGVSVVVTGHTHRPEVVDSRGVLHVNPGSASRPRQADGARTVGLLEIHASGALNVRILPLVG